MNVDHPLTEDQFLAEAEEAAAGLKDTAHQMSLSRLVIENNNNPVIQLMNFTPVKEEPSSSLKGIPFTIIYRQS